MPASSFRRAVRRSVNPMRQACEHSDQRQAEGPGHDFHQPDRSWSRTVVNEKTVGSSPVLQAEATGSRRQHDDQVDGQKPTRSNASPPSV